MSPQAPDAAPGRDPSDAGHGPHAPLTPNDPPSPSDSLTPSERRRRDAALREQMTRSSALNESARAQRLVDAFVAEARRRGIAAEPLRARLMDGREARTDKAGWYLRRNRSLAIGEDGGYYVLTVPGGLRERLRGVRLDPTPPPLVVGRGGRDGETGDLTFFLDRRLDEG